MNADPAACAARLEDAQRRGAPVAPTADDETMDITFGYAVQRQRLLLRSASGDEPVGFKVGLTSAAGRASFSTDEPVGGFLSAATVSTEGDVTLAGLIAPALEVEVAFVLGTDLDGQVTPRDVLDATAELAIAFEIIDSRWDGGARTAAMLVADNSYAARAVLGPRFAPGDVDLTQLAVTATVADTRLDGHAANVLGDPARALAWLAGHLAARGEGLGAGDIVLSGTLTAPAPLRPGDQAVADFGTLGQLKAHFHG